MRPTALGSATSCESPVFGSGPPQKDVAAKSNSRRPVLAVKEIAPSAVLNDWDACSHHHVFRTGEPLDRGAPGCVVEASSADRIVEFKAQLVDKSERIQSDILHSSQSLAKARALAPAIPSAYLHLLRKLSAAAVLFTFEEAHPA